jgi:hypothetical protein
MARESKIVDKSPSRPPRRAAPEPLTLSTPRGADSTEHRELVSKTAQFGIELCRRGFWEPGLVQLALVEANKGGGQAIPGLALSYLGYGIASQQGRIKEGIRFCRAGVDRQVWEAENHFNLARTCLLAGHLKQAIDALDYALGLDPTDPPMLELRLSLGLRKQPTFFFLDRGHPLNRLAGRLRHLAVSRMRGAPGSARQPVESGRPARPDGRSAARPAPSSSRGRRDEARAAGGNR